MGFQQKGKTCRSVHTNKLKSQKLRLSDGLLSDEGCDAVKVRKMPLSTHTMLPDQVPLDDAGTLGPAAVRSISFFWRLPLSGRFSLLITCLRYYSSTSFASFQATARTCWQMEATFKNSICVPFCRSFSICFLLFFQAFQAHVCQSGLQKFLITFPGRRNLLEASFSASWNCSPSKFQLETNFPTCRALERSCASCKSSKGRLDACIRNSLP